MKLIITKSQYKKILKESDHQNDVSEMITEFINHNFGEYNTEYNNTFDEVTLDVSIEYHVEKSFVWKSKPEKLMLIMVVLLLQNTKLLHRTQH